MSLSYYLSSIFFQTLVDDKQSIEEDDQRTIRCNFIFFMLFCIKLFFSLPPIIFLHMNRYMTPLYVFLNNYFISLLSSLTMRNFFESGEKQNRKCQGYYSFFFGGCQGYYSTQPRPMFRKRKLNPPLVSVSGAHHLKALPVSQPVQAHLHSPNQARRRHRSIL